MADDLASDVDSIITQRWKQRTGRVVPSTNDVALAGGAVELDATFLYADIASSSKMVKELDRRVAAKILKAFHSTTCRLLKSLGGTVVSFDGDRVLGVFIGRSKNTSTAKCALHLKYVVQQIIRPKFEAKYTSVREASFRIRHGAGADSGTVLVVRAGVQGDNDLIWIGRAPNLAAKLSDLRSYPHDTYITASVYNRMHDSAKYGGKDNENMWEARRWTFLGDTISVYRSNWSWEP